MEAKLLSMHYCFRDVKKQETPQNNILRESDCCREHPEQSVNLPLKGSSTEADVLLDKQYVLVSVIQKAADLNSRLCG